MSYTIRPPAPIVRPRTRFHVEHQTPPAWPSEVVTHDECERHLRKLRRTACGCMRYGSAIRRPKARIDLKSGISTETNVSRLFLTMSADRPLQGSDFACHTCADERCANPDHLYVGDHTSNVRDKFKPRRIRERRLARFYDWTLLEIPAAPHIPDIPVREAAATPLPHRPRIIPPPPLVVPLHP